MYIRRVYGPSMEPYLKEGNVIVLRKHSAKRKVNVGNIVMARIEGKEVIKRISAIDNGQIYLLGDNKTQSTDSRQFGSVDCEQIIAVYLFKL